MIELWKSNNKVAWAEKITLATTMKEDLPDELGLFYFSRITLAPVAAFEHVAGAALSGFLDHCMVTDDELNLHIRDLRYVHGQSEVMKGRPSITSVLLARQGDNPIGDPEWVLQLPEIWHQFQRIRAQRNI
jgi:hypothetical protein